VAIASAAKPGARVATKAAGQKIACLVELLGSSLEPQDLRSAAATRREEGATMITMNAFGVCPVVTAGDTGSHHAAHAAAAAAFAAAHKRRNAAASDASVDRGST
jgi:hypothetical protein